MVGLELVKFDPGFKQGLAVFDVAGMDGGNVGRLEGIGQDGNVHAVVNQLFYGFNTRFCGYKIRGDKVNAFLWLLEGVLQAFGNRRFVPVAV